MTDAVMETGLADEFPSDVFDFYIARHGWPSDRNAIRRAFLFAMTYTEICSQTFAELADPAAP